MLSDLIRNPPSEDSARNFVMNYFQKTYKRMRGQYFKYAFCFSAKSVKFESFYSDSFPHFIDAALFHTQSIQVPHTAWY